MAVGLYPAPRSLSRTDSWPGIAQPITTPVSESCSAILPLCSLCPLWFLNPNMGYYDHYCYLPLSIFSGDHLLWAQLRTADQPGYAGSLAAVERIITRLREQHGWWRTTFVIRGDSGFATDGLMDWCERTLRVWYVLGLQKHSRLNAAVAYVLMSALRCVASPWPKPVSLGPPAARSVNVCSRSAPPSAPRRERSGSTSAATIPPSRSSAKRPGPWHHQVRRPPQTNRTDRTSPAERKMTTTPPVCTSKGR